MAASNSETDYLNDPPLEQNGAKVLERKHFGSYDKDNALCNIG